MSNETKVGLFVIVSLAIFVASFIAIANVQLRGGIVRYKTYFTFAGGVEPGAAVRFGGRKAGRVAEVRTWAEDPLRVEVLLDLNPGTPIRQDSVANISSLGLLGENYLEITPGKKDAPPLAPGGTIPSIEKADFNALARRINDVAESSQALITDVHKNLNTIAAKADQLLANLNEVTGEKNRQSLENLLEKSNQMVSNQAPKIDAITDQVLQTTKKVDAMVDELRGTNTRAGELVGNVNKTVDETRSALLADLEQIQKTVAETQGLIEQLRGTLTYNDEHLNRIFENFRATSQNLAEFTAEVKQRPFSLIRVKPKPDRKVPAGLATEAQRRRE